MVVIVAVVVEVIVIRSTMDSFTAEIQFPATPQSLSTCKGWW